jgi:hypothetical protein
MKWRFILLLIFSLALEGIATNEPPPDFTNVYSEQSPNDGFKLICYKRDPKDFSSETQIWLEALKPDFKTQLIFTHWNRAHSLISSDDQYIAINYHVMSDLGEVHVFSRDKTGLFQEIKKDFGEIAHKLVRKELGSNIGFDHEYCYADYWLRDGLLLVHFEGHESGTHYLEPWYFIYDVKKDRFVFDLTDINKNAFHTTK